MNQKQAKRLRREAREQTVGLPDKDYMLDPCGYAVLIPNCTRYVYKQLKKQFKRSK